MAYTPKEWENGNIITAEALNNMEQGIADASSGGSVEVIKIAENFSGGSTSTSAPYFFTGGGRLSAPINELVGGKKIVGFVAQIESLQSGDLQAETNAVTLNVHPTGSEVGFNVIKNQNDSTIMSATSCDFCGMSYDEITPPCNFEIYAICI